MFRLLTQPNTWLITSMLAATTAFAQQNKPQPPPIPPYQRGHEAANCQMIASYSAPASFNVCNSWDVYVTASFIYWQARQENMEIGLISRNNADGKVITPVGTPFSTSSYENKITIPSPNFTYRPGFKVGLGANLNWDDWDAFAEYTWFHGSIGSGVKPLSPSTALTLPPNGQYLYPIQGAAPANNGVGDVFFHDADQSWSLKMDLLDLSLARSYYSGTKLTVRPFFGARGAWIRQNLTTTLNGSSEYGDAGGSFRGYFITRVSGYSASWGVGPRTGFESNWLMGYGFRLIGNASADILYTRYSTHLNQRTYQFAPVINPNHTDSSVSQKIDYLRSHLDLTMGFGWGSYFWRNGYHVDLSATYGFQVFWDQNMFRNFTSTSMSGKSNNPDGNLYIHGLTANARIDF